jgi:hypothetical protein
MTVAVWHGRDLHISSFIIWISVLHNEEWIDQVTENNSITSH